MMHVGCHNFVRTLTDQSPGLQVTYQESLEYWRPDEPPITTLLAELGQKIIVDLNETTKEASQLIFQTIEAAMTSNDNELVTAVGTGLIEAMVVKSFRDERVWQQLLSMLGKRSRSYAENWLNW